MRHSNVICLFMIGVFFVSCYPFQYPPPSVRKLFKNHCYDGQYTGIDTLININGYYESFDIGTTYKGSEVIRVDTFYYHFLFYNDGIFATFFDRDDTLEVFLKKAKDKMEGKDKNFSNYGFWWRYTIHNDSIQIVSVCPPPGFANTWYAGESWYKILDRNTIITLKNEYEYKSDSPFSKPGDPVVRSKYVVSPSRFYPVEDIPPATGWIVNKKWFRCN